MNYLKPTAPQPNSATNCVWMLIGLPASGKTTLARQLQRQYAQSQIVSPDQIRRQLYGSARIQGNWTEIWQQVSLEFQQAHSHQLQVIYDATNCKAAYRQAVISLAKEQGFAQIIGLWLRSPLWICLMRNQKRTHPVPEEVVIAMHQDLVTQPPQLTEGFGSLLYPQVSQDQEWLD
ncbi:MAG: ATP-binding protein [Pseudanabaenaceae cyanobacterium bins.68]|nr:ATP-binding protein [Pseudanabaenaceae cyanobacterium bins.68]